MDFVTEAIHLFRAECVLVSPHDATVVDHTRNGAGSIGASTVTKQPYFMVVGIVFDDEPVHGYTLITESFASCTVPDEVQEVLLRADTLLIPCNHIGLTWDDVVYHRRVLLFIKT
jgi:hypothetical protein